jgi:hypothetical protein
MARTQPFGTQLPPSVQPIEEEQEDHYYFVDLGDGVILEGDSDGELRSPQDLPSPPVVEQMPPATLAAWLLPYQLPRVEIRMTPETTQGLMMRLMMTMKEKTKALMSTMTSTMMVLTREICSVSCTHPRQRLATSPGCFGTHCKSWETLCNPCMSLITGPSHRLAPIT